VTNARRARCACEIIFSDVCTSSPLPLSSSVFSSDEGVNSHTLVLSRKWTDLRSSLIDWESLSRSIFYDIYVSLSRHTLSRITFSLIARSWRLDRKRLSVKSVMVSNDIGVRKKSTIWKDIRQTSRSANKRSKPSECSKPIREAKVEQNARARDYYGHKVHRQIIIKCGVVDQ